MIAPISYPEWPEKRTYDRAKSAFTFDCVTIPHVVGFANNGLTTRQFDNRGEVFWKPISTFGQGIDGGSEY